MLSADVIFFKYLNLWLDESMDAGLVDTEG
jgi:hypothetical protein